MDLIKAVTNYFQPENGFKLNISSDVPSGSGLGGSSTMMVAMIAAVSNYVGKEMSPDEIAALAYELERNVIGLKGGKQDQYAAAYGGFNCMWFGRENTCIKHVDMDPDVVNELQMRSVLCYTKITRESANVINSQVESTKKGTNIDALDRSKELALDLYKALHAGDIENAGRILDESWKYKKQLSGDVSNKLIDKLYNGAMAAGAIGGKVSGAGGGGFMYFITRFDKKAAVTESLRKNGAEISNFMFEPNGVVSWRSNND